MSLKIKDISKIIEDFAPIGLKESYDNVGLMVGDRESIVSSILIALDCTEAVIEEAKEKGCNFIITHHPLLFRKPSSITTDTLTGRKIMDLIRNNINLYSSHTNLDVVPGGINDSIVNILGYRNVEVIEPSIIDGRIDNSTGIGRLVVLEEEICLMELCDRVKKSLEINHIRYSGDESKKIKRIAVINGSGQDYFSAALKRGADCIITGDTTYHYVSDYSEDGIGIIDAGHFSTEWPAMKLFGINLKKVLKEKGFEGEVLISQNTRDPYKYR
jgi:dinuclear metal center YbgI/SA1388 family protein